MTDPRLENHAVGIELQIVELVEQRERALVQERHEDVARIQREIDALQQEMTLTAEVIAGAPVNPEVNAELDAVLPERSDDDDEIDGGLSPIP
jgi:DNA-binding protein H-NS